MKRQAIIIGIPLLLSNLYGGFDFGGSSGSCEGGNGTFKQQIPFQDVIEVDGTIPPDINGLNIYLKSDNDVDVQLFDKDTGKALVGWNIGALIGDGAGYATTPYKGMTIKYSGYNGDGTGQGHEYIKIIGKTPSNLIMKAYGYKAGYAKIDYSWKAKADCSESSTPSASGVGKPFEQQILHKAVIEVEGTIPPGINNLYISLKSDNDVDVQLFDKDTGKALVGWNIGALIGDGAGYATTPYKGMTIEYSGYNGDGVNYGNEYIKLTGKTTSNLVMKAYGYKAGFAKINYKWGNGNDNENNKPTISNIQYSNTKFKQSMILQINGNGLKNNLKFFIEDCINPKTIYNTDNLVKFQCLSNYTAGYKYGVIKDIQNKVLKEFTVFVKDDESVSHYDYLQGIDVSHHQGYINWTQVANNNIKFAYIKSTEGYLPTNTSESTLINKKALDNRFKENINNAISNNIFSGLYHFARPDLNKGLGGAENEAKHFVRFAKYYYQKYSMLPPVIDVENPNNVNFKSLYNGKDLSLWIQKWIETVKTELGVTPIIYTYGGYHTYLSGLNNYDLWVARYPLDSTNDKGKFKTLNWFDKKYRPTSGNWNDWSIWQYTSQGTNYVNGVNSGGLDRNIFRGTLNAMKQWAKDKK